MNSGEQKKMIKRKRRQEERKKMNGHKMITKRKEKKKKKRRWTNGVILYFNKSFSYLIFMVKAIEVERVYVIVKNVGVFL